MPHTSALFRYSQPQENTMSYTDVIAVLMCDTSCHDLAQEWLDDMWEQNTYITYTSVLAA